MNPFAAAIVLVVLAALAWLKTSRFWDGHRDLLNGFDEERRQR